MARNLKNEDAARYYKIQKFKVEWSIDRKRIKFRTIQSLFPDKTGYLSLLQPRLALQ
jgi:hypothetical protein